MDFGQSPQALFITCADSRIVPADLVNAAPGDLFVLRNIGNIVPARGTALGDTDHSVGAAVEFAVDVLKVHSIVVCGHSECGAMKALISGHAALGGSLGQWLAHGASALDRFRRDPGHATSPAPHNDLARLNVVEQMERLRAYPSVQRALADGQLRLHAWFFDLRRVKVTEWDEATGRFLAIEDTRLAPPVEPLRA